MVVFESCAFPWFSRADIINGKINRVRRKDNLPDKGDKITSSFKILIPNISLGFNVCFYNIGLNYKKNKTENNQLTYFGLVGS